MTLNEIILGVITADSDAVRQCVLPLSVANRHGLIAGATGTGKTVTLQLLAESFSRAGVPVVLPDVKGDLAGIAVPGVLSPKIAARRAAIGLGDYTPLGVPATLWRLGRGDAIPLRSTLSEFGPTLLSQVLALNETQTSVLSMLFKVADDRGLLLLDGKDLSALLKLVQEEDKTLEAEYGSFPPVTLSTIQRKLLTFLEESEDFALFGEPALKIPDLLALTPDGQGMVHVIHAADSVFKPKTYAAFLLWVLSELFESLDEVGDLDKPRLVFFFDEAHLLFDDAPKSLLDTIESIVRLIRSRGVGVYFITQRPADIPDKILAQLGSRIQHALRGYTPAEEKMVRSAVRTLRGADEIDAEKLVQTLGVGEALVSLLDANGVPQPVQKVLIAPPTSRMGPLTPEERTKIVKSSSFYDEYYQEVDRESAFEKLRDRVEVANNIKKNPPAKIAKDKYSGVEDFIGDTLQRTGRRILTSVIAQVANQVGRALSRGILGTFSKR